MEGISCLFHPVQTKLVFKSQIKESTVVEMEEKILEGLNERQRKVIAHIRKGGKITRREYEKLCETSERTANRELKDLVKRKIVRKSGSGVKSYYKMAR